MHTCQGAMIQIFILLHLFGIEKLQKKKILTHSPPKTNAYISMEASLVGQTYMKLTPMQIVHLKLLLFI